MKYVLIEMQDSKLLSSYFLFQLTSRFKCIDGNALPLALNENVKWAEEVKLYF